MGNYFHTNNFSDVLKSQILEITYQNLVNHEKFSSDEEYRFM